MGITPDNVVAWKPPTRWRNPRNSWRDAPRGYRALLSVGRTTPHQPPVSEEELRILEGAWPTYAKHPQDGTLSISERLDLVATGMLAASMSDIKGHHAKRDILTVFKAQDRARREYLCPNPDIFSGYDPFVDRRMHSMVEQWWTTGVSA